MIGTPGDAPVPRPDECGSPCGGQAGNTGFTADDAIPYVRPFRLEGSERLWQHRRTSRVAGAPSSAIKVLLPQVVPRKACRSADSHRTMNV
jgi:hypothetical protein